MNMQSRYVLRNPRHHRGIFKAGEGSLSDVLMFDMPDADGVLQRVAMWCGEVVVSRFQAYRIDGRVRIVIAVNSARELNALVDVVRWQAGVQGLRTSAVVEGDSSTQDHPRYRRVGSSRPKSRRLRRKR